MSNGNTETVFAVTWQGFAQPDLSELLGSYFDEYRQIRPSPGRRIGRGFRSLQSAHLRVERSGHMRDVRGKAYVPSLLPQGFRPEDIQ